MRKNAATVKCSAGAPEMSRRNWHGKLPRPQQGAVPTSQGFRLHSGYIEKIERLNLWNTFNRQNIFKLCKNNITTASSDTINKQHVRSIFKFHNVQSIFAFESPNICFVFSPWKISMIPALGVKKQD